MLLAAYGLTARERDVCREVPAGLSTADIAARLAISAHTVQDHLESVFGKVVFVPEMRCRRPQLHDTVRKLRGSGLSGDRDPPA